MKELCLELTEGVNTAVYECIGYSFIDKLASSEWVEKLFDFSNNEIKKRDKVCLSIYC